MRIYHLPLANSYPSCAWHSGSCNPLSAAAHDKKFDVLFSSGNRKNLLQEALYNRINVGCFASISSSLMVPGIRGGMHRHPPDENHWTVRLFEGGSAKATLHIFCGDRLPEFFRNGGRWNPGRRVLHRRECTEL